MAKRKVKQPERLSPVSVNGLNIAAILAAAESLLEAEEAAAIRRRSDPGSAAHSLMGPRRELSQAIGGIQAGGWLSDADQVSRIPIALRQLVDVVNDPDNLASTMKLRAAVANLRDEEIELPGDKQGIEHETLVSEEASILAALDDVYPRALVQDDIAVACEPPISRRTVGKYLSVLRTKGLVASAGKRKGDAITEQGRRLLSEK